MPDFRMKTTSFGGCFADWAVPSRDQLNAETKVLSFMFTFEDALKLKTMIEDGALWLNRVNRTTAEGKRAALKLNIRLTDGRFYAMKGQMPVDSQRHPRQAPEAEEEE